MAEIKPPELRGEDEHGNVRPADDRYLSKAQQRKRDSHVAKVEEAEAEAQLRDEPAEDPFAEVLTNAVQSALTQPDPIHQEVKP